MDIESKITITLGVKDMEQVLTKAIINMVKTKYGMCITETQIARIQFNVTTEYGPMNREVGTPIFAGTTIEISPPV